ncbi:hypothetical protein FO519_001946 [Halicephalobus sp. NKZ332]|nr:hypothetical protein FO519_001946 [Halicephalobus sp. NKZ332]
MPMVVITGLPSSGKSTIARRIADSIKEKHPETEVCVVTDEDFSETPIRSLYGNVLMEKQWRAKQKRTISQSLQKDIVISDNMNYIKGYRYELYCLSKNSHKRSIVVFVAADVDTCKFLNSEKQESDRYTNEKIGELAQRYETPNPNDRWDSPLIKIEISKEDKLPKTVEIDFDLILDYLFNDEKVKPNDSTVPKAEHEADKLNRMQIITQEIIQTIIQKQSTSLSLGKIVVPHSNSVYLCRKILTMPQLIRSKAQFLQVLKTNEAIGTDVVGTHFVEFLNTL